MAQTQVYEGTPEQLVEQLSKLPNTRKYKMTITPEDRETIRTRPHMITFGMFPQLLAITEDDFKNTEWRCEAIES